MRRALKGICIALLVGAFGVSCSGSTREARTADQAGDEPAARFRAFRDQYIERRTELETHWNSAGWAAYLSGDDADFERYRNFELQMRRFHSDREAFAMLRELRDGGQITDPMLRRQLEVIYLAYADNQIDDELMQRIVAAQSELEQLFNTYRARVGDEALTRNQVYQVLDESNDNERRRAVWEAAKGVGEQVAPRLVELVHLRNQAAQAMGYANYYEMQLRLAEQDPEEIRRVFDELATLTDEPFRAVKAQLDAQLAQRFGLPVDQLRPWHYADPFFQSAPTTGVDRDRFFESPDRDHLVTIATSFYQGIGLPVQDILSRSDLYEREGKSEHAFCTHLDRSGDVRILTNLQNNEQWMGTLLHELGHGVYDANLDQALPFELREPAHTFTTEGVAELFGMLTFDPVWLRRHGAAPADLPADFDAQVEAQLRLDLLIFARWTLVMLNFERELYTNPDRDLNALWWDIVERYQFLHRPESAQGGFHFATKDHLVVAPVYYHNYMLGRMFSAQLRHRIGEVVPETMASGRFDMHDQPAVGHFLIEHVFRPGALYPWSEFVRRATGEELTARYFAEAIQPPATAP